MLYVDMEVNGVPLKVLTWFIHPVCFFLINCFSKRPQPESENTTKFSKREIWG